MLGLVDNKIHVFAGQDYYPGGGMDDYIGCAATIEAAKAMVPENCDWAHAATVKPGSYTLEVIKEWRRHRAWSRKDKMPGPLIDADKWDYKNPEQED